ncbi:MAG: SLBB domain-containing protein, partial [Bacteroidota bacterium]
MTQPIFKASLLAFGFFVVLSSLAVRAQTPDQTPAPLLPTNQLPNLQTRINQLQQGGGIPPDQIDSYIQGIQGARPGTVIPIEPNAQSGFPTPGVPGSETSEVPRVEVLGTEDVLEDDQGFDDRPLEVPTVLLNPDIQTKIFGHHLFDLDSDYDFSKEAGSLPPDEYIIGPGDIIAITVYGSSELFESLTVGDDGSVVRPYIGKVYVGGKSYGEARKVLSSAYRSIVSSQASIEVRLTGDRRTINVNIIGEVRKPGGYQINAGMPAFNALFAAGGINEVGSVRNIQIRRNGKIVQTVDLYRYLIEGEEEPVLLQNNDFIYVPIQYKTAEISGGIRRPMAYELLPGENLKSLIFFAGGLNFNAKQSKAQIARLEQEREVLIDFNLEEVLKNSDKDYAVGSGDRIIIERINLGAYNVVQVFGDVEYPGTYQLNPADKVLNLINRAGGLGISAWEIGV